MKLGVVGSRGFTDYSIFEKHLKATIEHYSITCLVSGGAAGPDKMAERFAKENGIPIIIHEAEWDIYGLSAGFRRNKLIWADSDMILAFWDGESKGTRHTIENYKGKLFVLAVDTDQEEW